MPSATSLIFVSMKLLHTTGVGAAVGYGRKGAAGKLKAFSGNRAAGPRPSAVENDAAEAHVGVGEGHDAHAQMTASGDRLAALARMAAFLPPFCNLPHVLRFRYASGLAPQPDPGFPNAIFQDLRRTCGDSLVL